MIGRKSRQGRDVTRFLLASGSPRRRELFALLRLPFDIASADVDESPRDGETPAQMVARLAQTKALNASASGGARLAARWVIAADTTVSLDGIPLGKPADDADAWRMLRTLRGRTHQVPHGYHSSRYSHQPDAFRPGDN